MIAVTGLDDAGEFFGVEMEQVAGMGVFVALHGHGGLEIAGVAEVVAAEDAADGLARLKPVVWATRTPVLRWRRRARTRSMSSAQV